jgi:uncharacterized protein YjiK
MKGLNFFGKILLPIFSITVLIIGCKPKKLVYKSPPHYNFSDPKEYKLDLRIREISGLAWDSQNDEFLTHNDEKGVIYFLDKETKEIKEGREIKFAGKGDYEDIAIVNGVPYVLLSNGTITKIVTDSAGVKTGVEAGKISISGTNDFEAMYYDSSRKALIVLCKNCDMDDKKTVSAFAFYPDSTGFVDKPVFTIDAAKVDEMSPRKTSKLQPSAAAIHPKLNKLFILSSASNQLVIADLNGNVESVFMLAKKLFPQPEGIAFKSAGDLFISNEGGIGAKGTIIRFAYIP